MTLISKLSINRLLQNLAILTIDQVEKKEADIQKAVNYNYTDKDIELVNFLHLVDKLLLTNSEVWIHAQFH